MPTQTQGSGIPTPPKILGGKEVYDMIMGKIEPELTTENLATLEEKYKGESKEDMKKRAERYKAAFLEYKRQYAIYKKEQEDNVKTYSRSVMGAVEGKSAARDQNKLDDLESAISNS